MIVIMTKLSDCDDPLLRHLVKYQILPAMSVVMPMLVTIVKDRVEVIQPWKKSWGWSFGIVQMRTVETVAHTAKWMSFMSSSHVKSMHRW